MRSSLLCLAIFSLLVASAGMASGATLCSSIATLQDWSTAGSAGCTITAPDGATWTFVFGGANETPAGNGFTPALSNISTTFGTVAPGEVGFSFAFGANANCTSPAGSNFCAPSTGKADIELSYYVSSSSTDIIDLFQSITGTAVGTNTSNTGVDSLTDQYSLGCAKTPITSCAGSVSAPIVSITEANSGTTQTQTNTFSATNAVSVTKDMQACSASSCGAPGLAGATDITNVKNAFSTSSVPEPKQVGFLGTALLGLIAITLRRRKQEQPQ
ncbi:MAG TPA: hypothetical protein VKX49_03390 [Bryobacteraceae bacterium]|nr:hypothetical protein [Bryobacteraceae bacterium]